MVEWLNRRGVFARWIENARIKDIHNRIVVGSLPLRLASMTKCVYAVIMPNSITTQCADPDNMTPEEMDEAGAYLAKFTVTCEKADASDLIGGEQ